MARRLQQEGGFGLIELMIAMMIMTIGITAIVAGFSAGYVATHKASRTATAGTLADKQMEGYRALQYSNIALNSALVTSAETDTRYTGDTAWVSSTNAAAVAPSAGCVSTTVTCQPLRASVVGPGGGTFRIDTYVVWSCPVGTLGGTQAAPTCTTSGTPVARAVKKVTVVVRDAATTSKTLFRETSTFDQAT